MEEIESTETPGIVLPRLGRALHMAVRSRRVHWLKLLVCLGAPVNARDDSKRTALHVACESEDDDVRGVVNALLRFGADINAQDLKGETPLHEACWRMNHSVVESLIRNRAQVGIANSRGKTPLHVVASAAYNKSTISIVHSLLAAEDAEKASQQVDDGEVVGVVNWVDNAGYTALHHASEKNNHELVQVLLQRDVNVGARNKEGMTALHCAARACAVDVVAVLVDNGADVNAKDLQGNTPLHFCSSRFNRFAATSRGETIEHLLSKGADVLEKNVQQKTPYEEISVRHSSADPFPFQIDREEMETIEETFIKHFIKQTTLKVRGEFDITWVLGPEFYDKLRTLCCKELEEMKSIEVAKGISLYDVLLNANKPDYIFTEDLQQIDELLRSPELLKKFPLYGQTLRTMCQPLTLAKQEFPTRQSQDLVDDLRTWWQKNKVTPEVPIDPVIPNLHVIPEIPVIPEMPVNPVNPVIPNFPVIPEIHVIPEMPVNPVNPVIHNFPDIPEIHVNPIKSKFPDIPKIHVNPVITDNPKIPVVPDIPGTRGIPE